MSRKIDVREIPFYNEWYDESPTVTLHTSGSTGQPSSFVAEKRRMEASARRTCEFLGLKRGDKALLCMSADFVGGKMMIVRAITCGLRLDCVIPSGNPLKGICDESYDLVAMVPMQVYNSLSEPMEKEKLMKIRNLIIGGGPVDWSLAQRLRDFPNKVWSTYGMTETLSHIALRRLSGNEADEWYSPLPGVTVTLDEDGRIVINAPEICDGILVTNDRGEMHADGRRFKVLGRMDNTINSGGLKFQIEEIEGMLAGHLSVQVIITKRPDEKFGEIVTLLYSEGMEHELQEVCTRILPKYMQPKAYIKVDALPYTASGKPARAEALKITVKANDIKKI